MLRSLPRTLPTVRALRISPCFGISSSPSLQASRALCTSGKSAPATPAPVEQSFEDNDINQLEGKRSREAIHSAFASRSMDAIRYDYFAQRAELEAEIEAATAFRSLVETSRQQAMGYLELMEEYGDAEFGATLENIDVAAGAERENAEEVYRAAASVAADEGLEEIEMYFDDMAAASSRAATRLELVSSIINAEDMHENDMNDDGEDVPDSGNTKN